MPKTAPTTRANQRLRTRKDLLDAAARLLKQGRTPSIDEVAAEAMVSRATAYRYFPTVDALLLEAPLDGEMPDPQTAFAADAPTDVPARIDHAEALLHEMTYRNEAQLRAMLAGSMERWAKGARTTHGVPLRQNRRTALIAAALKPARQRLRRDTYDKLCAALAVFFGPEAMIVFSDVLGLDARKAREVKAWAVRTLVSAALEETSARR